MDTSSFSLFDINEHEHEHEHEHVKKPTVHYPDDVKPEHPFSFSLHQRTDSSEGLPLNGGGPGSAPGSRAASLAGTDDENDGDEDYDWSDEEDLIDEEAKFEKHMGVKVGKKGWGFKRYVFSTSILL